MTEEEQQQQELDHLVNQADQEKILDGEFQPNEESSQQSSSNISTADLMTLLIKAGFNLVASFRGDHWRVTDEAATEAGDEFGACIDYYYPNINPAPWAGTLIAGSALLVPRLMVDRQIEEAKAKAEQEATAKEGQNTTTSKQDLDSGD